LRIRAADLDTLFAEAGQALFAAIVEDLRRSSPGKGLTSTWKATTASNLLFDWLKELLYHFDTSTCSSCVSTYMFGGRIDRHRVG